LNSAYTQICSFEPKLLLTTPDSLEAVRDYWMRVKFDNLAGRSVKLRHLQPVSPHCDAAGNPAAYNRLNSCTTMSSTITINNNQLHKPRLSMYGQVWAPLVLKNNTYKVTLKV